MRVTQCLSEEPDAWGIVDAPICRNDSREAQVHDSRGRQRRSDAPEMNICRAVLFVALVPVQEQSVFRASPRICSGRRRCVHSRFAASTQARGRNEGRGALPQISGEVRFRAVLQAQPVGHHQKTRMRGVSLTSLAGQRRAGKNKPRGKQPGNDPKQPWPAGPSQISPPFPG